MTYYNSDHTTFAKPRRSTNATSGWRRRCLTHVGCFVGYHTLVPPKQQPREFQFDLSGGHLALDFANTVSRRDDPAKCNDHLRDYHDLVSFAQQSGVVTLSEAASLRHQASGQEKQATQALRSAIALREALYRSFQRAAVARPASPPDIELIEKFNWAALRHRRISRAHRGYAWKWEQGSDLERILWPIAHAGAELIASHSLQSVRECEASDCAWLFLDTSRNHSRRWCDMSVCGNREKARRHYQRQHGE